MNTIKVPFKLENESETRYAEFEYCISGNFTHKFYCLDSFHIDDILNDENFLNNTFKRIEKFSYEHLVFHFIGELKISDDLAPNKEYVFKRFHVDIINAGKKTVVHFESYDKEFYLYEHKILKKMFSEYFLKNLNEEILTIAKQELKESVKKYYNEQLIKMKQNVLKLETIINNSILIHE